MKKTPSSAKRSHRRPLCVESLETRELLASHGFGFAATNLLRTADSHEVASLFNNVASRLASSFLEGHFGDSRGDRSAHAESVFVATLAGAGTEKVAVKFAAENENGTTESELKVSASNLAPNSMLDVVIGGVAVGQLVTDANGQGSLVLSSDPTDSQLPLPADFPTIAAGTSVQIGPDLSGAFETPTSTNPGGYPRERGGWRHGMRHGRESSETKLVSVLQGTGSQMGFVEYETGEENGSAVTELEVSVNSLTPNSTLDVVIGGVTVGEITTDANGHGVLDLSSAPQRSNELPLPADFPAVAAGVTVQIGPDLSGTFKAPAGQQAVSSLFAARPRIQAAAPNFGHTRVEPMQFRAASRRR